MMPKDMTDPILSILEEYERDPARNEKKAVLLMPQGGYFLYGNRFCSIQDYDLEFQSDSCRIQGNSVQNAIFLGLLQDGFHAVGEQAYKPDLVSLIFHIDLGDSELLRGILLTLDAETRFTLFCDATVEELYRLSRKVAARSAPQIIPNEDLQQYAETLRRDDLHGQTGLYLLSKPLKNIDIEKS